MPEINHPVNNGEVATATTKWPTLGKSLDLLIDKPYLTNDDHIVDPQEGLARIQHFMRVNRETIRKSLILSK